VNFADQAHVGARHEGLDVHQDQHAVDFLVAKAKSKPAKGAKEKMK
jgi:hypothetical protein